MKSETIHLPEPVLESRVSVEKALASRRSVRGFSRVSMSVTEVSQLLWAGQGITDRNERLRTAPSAGALYPLETYLFAGNIDGLEVGIYRYIPDSHSLRLILSGDFRKELCLAALSQSWVERAPANILITVVWPRIMRRYGTRGRLYATLEAGHAAQNIMLQCISLGLGSVPIGAFYDDEIKRLANLGKDEDPLYLLTVGKT